MTFIIIASLALLVALVITWGVWADLGLAEAIGAFALSTFILGTLSFAITGICGSYEAEHWEDRPSTVTSSMEYKLADHSPIEIPSAVTSSRSANFAVTTPDNKVQFFSTSYDSLKVEDSTKASTVTVKQHHYEFGTGVWPWGNSTDKVEVLVK